MKENEKIFIIRDGFTPVYKHQYSYDCMKVMGTLQGMLCDKKITGIPGELFCWEIMCQICLTVEMYWNEEILTKDNQYYWFMKPINKEEEGYVQAYAERVLPLIVREFYEQGKC